MKNSKYAYVILLIVLLAGLVIINLGRKPAKMPVVHADSTVYHIEWKMKIDSIILNGLDSSADAEITEGEN